MTTHKNYIAFIVIAIAALVFSGCVNYLGTPSFDGNISFVIKEEFAAQTGATHLFLRVSTADLRGGGCSYWEHKISIGDTTIKVTLGDVKEGGGIGVACTADVRAESFYSYLDLSDGNYLLEFHAKDKTDKYALRISKEKISLEPVQTSFSTTDRLEINRPPENWLEAECHYNGKWFDPLDGFCLRFFDEVGKIAKPYLAAEEGKMPENLFYTYVGEEGVLFDVLRRYWEQEFKVAISTWKGKEFACGTECIITEPAQFPNMQIRYMEPPLLAVSECQDSDEYRQSYCIIEVAFNLKDEKVCEQLPEEYQSIWGIERCLAFVAVAKLDESICGKASSCPSCALDCYSFIAVKKSMPSICDELRKDNPNYRNRCYTEYAHAKRNYSVCNSIMDDTQEADYCRYW